jgi:hypothetical protein
MLSEKLTIIRVRLGLEKKTHNRKQSVGKIY